MKPRRKTVAAAAAAMLLLQFGEVKACGPFIEPDVFIHVNAPDHLDAYIAGKLGILEAGYDSDEYAIAYRYLDGGKLSKNEQAAVRPPAPRDGDPEEETGNAQATDEGQPWLAGRPWLAARREYLPAAPAGGAQAPNTDEQDNIYYDPDYPNCPKAAFENAVLTLNERAATWGAQSPWLMDWIRGQDAVFANCAAHGHTMPAAVPADGPQLLRADRAYQTAAANFYSRNFDEAATQFDAIAQDKGSRWSSLGDYLAARATVRKAFENGKASGPNSGNAATFDPELMLKAQTMLEDLLKQPNPQPSRAAVENELNFVRIRTEPQKRIEEICAALAGPEPDANFGQDLDDLSWVLLKQVKIENPPPLLQWIAAWRGAGTAATAYATWQQTHALPWLVMALAKAGPQEPFTPALLDAAAKIRPSEPAYETAFFHRVRLLMALKRDGEARALLDAELPAAQHGLAGSYENALLGERMAEARSFGEFLRYAPRTVLDEYSSGAGDAQQACQKQAQEDHASQPCTMAENLPGFDEDSVAVLNRETPLALLVKAASEPSLPTDLRENIVLAAWTRSVVLEDATSAAALAPLLPKAIRDVAGDGVDFAADLAILHNPGLRPYLEPGISRLSSFQELDTYRDNWWSSDWSTEFGGSDAKTVRVMDASGFLTPEQIAAGAAEYKSLMELPDAEVVLGRRVLAYAQRHPEDARVPEALAMTVRATRYGAETADQGGSDFSEQVTQVSKAAFQLLHSRYAGSPWTAKTPYYF
jgi:hypothetical protein